MMMKTLKLNRCVAHTPENLLDMVANVTDYPIFIRSISHMRVRQFRQITPHQTECLADAIICHKNWRIPFCSEVYVDKQALTVQSHKPNSRGLIRHLSSHWQFNTNANGSEVNFTLEVDVKAGLLNILQDDILQRSSEKMIDLFIARADTLYAR